MLLTFFFLRSQNTCNLKDDFFLFYFTNTVQITQRRDFRVRTRPLTPSLAVRSITLQGWGCTVIQKIFFFLPSLPVGKISTSKANESLEGVSKTMITIYAPIEMLCRSTCAANFPIQNDEPHRRVAILNSCRAGLWDLFGTERQCTNTPHGTGDTERSADCTALNLKFSNCTG